MNVVLLGASGMVGQGALQACLRDETVARVTAVCRGPLAVSHPKLQVVPHQDFGDLTPLRGLFAQADACYFCVGVPSAGLSEEDYTRVTYDFALAAADALLSTGRDDVTFVYVSGAGADSTEQGPVMWARVKGRAENALLKFPFRTYVFRPGYIRPTHGARPRTRGSRVLYGATSWLYPVLHRLFPDRTTTTDAIGRAALAVSRTDDRTSRVLTSGDINRLAAG